MKLRSVTLKDIDLIIENECESSQHPWSTQNLSQSILAGDDCKIASIEREDVGYCVVKQLPGVSEILNLVIFVPHQGKGFGTKLLQLISGEAELRESAEIWLEVRESNLAARRLYRGGGFVEQSIRKNYYPRVTTTDSRPKENAVLMTCLLTCCDKQ